MSTYRLPSLTTSITSLLQYAQPSPSAHDLVSQAILALSRKQRDLVKAAIIELTNKYPDVAQQIFFYTWEVAGRPTPETMPEIAHPDFGRLAFIDEEGRSISNEQKMEILSRVEKTTCELCNPGIVDEQIVYWDGRYWNVICPSAPAMQGHLTIVPRRHVDRFDHLSAEEAGSLIKVLKKCGKVFQHLYQTDGYITTSLNAGSSDQSLPHFHMHLIPTLFDTTQVLAHLAPSFLLKRLGTIRETFEQVVHYPKEIKSLGKLYFSPCQSEIDSKLLHTGVRWRLEVLLQRVSNENQKLQIRSLLERLVDSRIATKSHFFENLREIDHQLSSSTLPFSYGRDRHSSCTPFRFNQVFSCCTPMNGSFIKFPEDGQPYSTAKTYCIAMNAPLPPYFPLTLNMYIEQNVKLVINLTEFEEGDIIKADRYLPTTPLETVRHRNYSITCNAIAQTPLSNDWILEQNECLLKDEDRHHLFTSFHLRGWKDHTPGNVSSIAFAIKMIAKYEKLCAKGTIVVHCSGGIGRTGVFIIGKKILEDIEQGKDPDIRSIAASLRLQRRILGGSEEQYKVLYGLPDEFRRLISSSF